jgi:hypothetical protein
MLFNFSNGLVKRVKAINVTYGLFLVTIFFFFVLIFTIFFIDLFFQPTNY